MKITNKVIAKWEEVEFESSSQTTKEFTTFARDFRQVIKEQIGNDFAIASYSKGHFYISGFLKHVETGNYIYFSISDVRHFPNEWIKQVLIRTAKDTKDYTGGHNNYTRLSNFGENALRLIQ